MDKNLYESVVSRTQFLHGIYSSRKSQMEGYRKTLEKLKHDKDVLEKTEKVFKHLIDKLGKKDLSLMDKLITYGLNTVFPDKNLEFKSELKERGKKINIDLQTWYDGNQVDTQTRSSIDVVISFLLRMLCIMKLKKARLLLLDETFAAVDAGYIDNVSNLVAKLADKMNMDVLLVTHNPGFAESERKCYRIVKKGEQVELEKTK